MGTGQPLQVDGYRRAGADVMDAYQYFFDANGNQTGSVPAGMMEWDARSDHGHWHFTDFARYRLLDAGRTTAVHSGKEAFCLATRTRSTTRFQHVGGGRHVGTGQGKPLVTCRQVAQPG